MRIYSYYPFSDFLRITSNIFALFSLIKISFDVYMILFLENNAFIIRARRRDISEKYKIKIHVKTNFEVNQRFNTFF
jgi:hypothetical protein